MKFIRQMRGGSKALLVEANDEHCYVVKALQNPQGRRTLINEMLSYQIYRNLDVRVPTCRLIRVSKEFINTLRDQHVEIAAGRRPIEPGLHFASQLTLAPDKHTIYDLMPTPLLTKVANIEDFVRALVIDQWITHLDSRQAVFYRQGRLLAEMIDNGYTLGGESWNLTECFLTGLYRDPAVYDRIQSFADLEPHILSVLNYPETCLLSAMRLVPEEWFGGIPEEKHELRRTLERLVVKRNRIQHVMEDFVSTCGSHVFQHWDTSYRNGQKC